MIIDETLLWSKLESFSLDNPNEALTFSQRLARENNWTASFTERVILEYKKFLFLCATSSRPVTPSDEVDQAWHLHLVYTKSYWNDLCKNILGKDIHHNPTQGGQKESDKFTDYYEATLLLYQEKFGEAPPQDIWPPTPQRFSDIDFVRANKRTHWLIPKFRWTWNKAALLLIVAGVAASWAFETATIIIIALIGVFILVLQPGRRTNQNPGTNSGCSPVILAGSDGGDNDGHHHGHSGCSAGDGHSGCSADSGSGCSGGGCSGGD